MLARSGGVPLAVAPSHHASKWRNILSNKMIRRGASILAAAAVVACGLTVGAGTASASCQAKGDLSRINSITEPLDVESIGRYCPGAVQSARGSVENVDVGRVVKMEVSPGDVVPYTSSFVLGGDPDRSLTKVVDHAPTGFVMTRVEVVLDEWIDRVNQRTPIEVGHVVQDSSTGAVTITPGGGGWPIPHSNDTTFPSIKVTVFYRVPLNVKDGDFLPSGVMFEATGLTGTQGWSPMDGASTKVFNQPADVFGSSGS
ncbi:hypothetical protein [Rhodococcus sp. NPDC059234]|uniref:hypothetical protein n=1 Tax=Rhodococcus sp. NPDC059234 TaxID=3346781 RepID=UPI00366E5F77